MPDIEVFDETTNTLGKKKVVVKDHETGLTYDYTKRSGGWSRGPSTKSVDGQVGRQLVMVNDDELIDQFDEAMRDAGYDVLAR